MDETKGVGTAPALGISLNAQFAAGRQIVFQTHIDQSASGDEIKMILDKMNTAIDQQEAFYLIDQLEREAERDDQMVYSMSHTLNDLDIRLQNKWEQSGKRAAFKLSPQEESQKKQAVETLERQKKIAEGSKSRLAEARVKAGNRDGASSPADR